MSAKLFFHPAPPAEARSTVGDGASRGGQAEVSTERVAARHVVHGFWQCPDLARPRDAAAVAGFSLPIPAASPARALIAAGHELARLSAALAFFRSRSSGNTADCQIGRLRV